MQQVAPKLGARVVAKAFLTRRTEYVPGNTFIRERRLKVWDRTPFKDPLHGIYVGRRNKSNGDTQYDYDAGFLYTPVAYFEVWMVAYADNRDILVCLPSDIVLEE